MEKCNAIYSALCGWYIIIDLLTVLYQNYILNLLVISYTGDFTFPTNKLSRHSLDNLLGRVTNSMDGIDINEDGDDDVGKTAVDAILWFLGGILLIGLLISCIVKIRKVAMRRNSECQQVVVSEKLYRDQRK